MTRRHFLAATLAATAPRPNVLLILADDLGYGDLGCNGSTTLRTPHIDRLAADGVRFTDHYTGSPVCSPARASLLTGMVPDRTGVTGVLRDDGDATTGLRLGLPTMADEFRRQGYRTALIGKWHLGMSQPYWPNRRGFDYFWGFLNGTIDYNTHLSAGGGGRGRPTSYENGEPIQIGEGYQPELTTARAVRFIEENQTTAPWFLYLALALPHPPLQAPERWVRPFRDHLDNTRATYAGMVACMDDTVGQVRVALERTRQWDRTIVLFLSDNGWVKKVTPDVAPAGSNGAFRGGKYELLEGGIRSPGVLRWPGVTEPGTTCREPSWFPDWLPTFTGKPTPDGADLRKVIAGRGRLRERTPHWSFIDPLVKTPQCYAARRGRWKYLDMAGAKHLYDLEADPGETTSRIAAHPRIAAAMEKSLEEWKKSLRPATSLATNQGSR